MRRLKRTLFCWGPQLMPEMYIAMLRSCERIPSYALTTLTHYNRLKSWLFIKKKKNSQWKKKEKKRNPWYFQKKKKKKKKQILIVNHHMYHKKIPTWNNIVEEYQSFVVLRENNAVWLCKNQHSPASEWPKPTF